MSRIPVVLDCDPGIDDFFAWMLLYSSEKYDIRAVTTVPGNNTLETVTRNARGIYRLFRMSGTRLAAGARTHMLKPVDVPPMAHGSTGLGEVVLDPGDQPLDEKPAWDVIYEEAVKAGGELEIFAVGPLTNLGIAFFKYPDLKKLVRKMVIMGGTTTSGNMGAYGEANICHDPHAAAIVFNTGIPIDMVGLNALMPCAMEGEDMEKLMPENLNREIRDNCLEIMKSRHYPLCDAVTVAAELREDFAQWAECYVDIETRSELSSGMTVCDLGHSKDFLGSAGGQRKCRVAITSNGEMFYEMFREMFKKYCW